MKKIGLPKRLHKLCVVVVSPGYWALTWEVWKHLQCVCLQTFNMIGSHNLDMLDLSGIHKLEKNNSLICFQFMRKCNLVSSERKPKTCSKIFRSDIIDSLHNKPLFITLIQSSDHVFSLYFVYSVLLLTKYWKSSAEFTTLLLWASQVAVDMHASLDMYVSKQMSIPRCLWLCLQGWGGSFHH